MIYQLSLQIIRRAGRWTLKVYGLDEATNKPVFRVFEAGTRTEIFKLISFIDKGKEDTDYVLRKEVTNNSR